MGSLQGGGEEERRCSDDHPSVWRGEVLLRQGRSQPGGANAGGLLRRGIGGSCHEEDTPPTHAHLVEGGDLDALDEEALLAALNAAGELRMERGHGRVRCMNGSCVGRGRGGGNLLEEKQGRRLSPKTPTRAETFTTAI